MSRSYYRSMFTGVTTCRSEAFDKKLWHKKWRLGQKKVIQIHLKKDCLDVRQVHHREVSDPWMMGKDGKIAIVKSSSPQKC